VKEVLRWAHITPYGIPHRSIQDDWYNGYFIPKHSIIIPNYWCMNRSREIYGADAHDFNPARYLETNGQLAPAPPDTREEGHISFGFGRRYCIGARVTNESMFINLAITLWAMKIDCATGVEGKPIPVDVVDCVEEGLAV